MTTQMTGTNSKDLNAQIESSKQYISIMEENIATINTEIDTTGNTDTKPTFDKDKMLKWLQNFTASKTYNIKTE